MEVKNVYIGASSCVSVQDTFDNPQWFASVKSLTGAYAKALAPDYKQYLDPMATRRMSKVLKNSLLSAKQAFAKQGIETPDAVITATGWGCQEDTIKFLDSFETLGEELLSPTSFIQSTHNTIGGLIAMTVKCNGYNNTIAHHLTSFETALLDAVLLINENTKPFTTYVGGIDELTDFFAGVFTKAACFDSTHAVTEAATSFIVHNDPSKIKTAALTQVAVMQGDQSSLLPLLSAHKPDLILCSNAIDTDIPVFDYRSWCGDFSTASAFGLFLACELLNKEEARKSLPVKGIDQISKIAILNVYKGGLCSYLQIETC